jgi:hypothetical protein
MSVLEWPGLRQLAQWPDIAVGSTPVRFDPTGRYLEVAGSAFSILDIATGRVVRPSGATGQTPVWDASSHLIVPRLDGTAATYALDGSLKATQAAADSAAGSANGQTVLYFWWESQRPILVSIGASVRDVDVPGVLWTYPEVSADGSRIAILCRVSSDYEAFLLTSQ